MTGGNNSPRSASTAHFKCTVRTAGSARWDSGFKFSQLFCRFWSWREVCELERSISDWVTTAAAQPPSLVLINPQNGGPLVLGCSVGARTRRVEFVSTRLSVVWRGLLCRSKFRTSAVNSKLSMYADLGHFEFQVLGCIHQLSLVFTPVVGNTSQYSEHHLKRHANYWLDIFIDLINW